MNGHVAISFNIRLVFFFYSHEVKGLSAAYMTKENVNKQTKKHSSNKQKAHEKA